MTLNNNKKVYAILSLPIIAYTLMVLIYAVNVPWFDDIEVFPEFILKFNKLNNWTEKLELIFRPNNEHRIVLAKTVTLLDYYFNGDLNMRRLQLYCNLTMLGFLIVFWKIFKSYRLPISYFIPIPFLLLHPQYYLLSLWAITGYQSICVLFIGFWGMYCLAKNSLKWYLFAIILISIASFTMSNGMFFWFAGIFVLILQGHLKRTIGWILWAVLTIKLYFYNFDTTANSIGFAYFFANPLESVYGFFVHLGGALDFLNTLPIHKRMVFPLVAGFVTLLMGVLSMVSIFTFSSKLFNVFKLKNNKILHSIFENLNRSPLYLAIVGVWFFIVINAVIIAVLRTRFGMDVMLIGNYRIYPIVFLVISYLLLILGWKIKEKVIYFSISISIIFWFCSYLKFLPEVHERRKDLLTRAYNQEHNSIGLGPYIGSEYQVIVENVFKELIESKIYTYPKSVFKDSKGNFQVTEKNILPITITKGDNGIIAFENANLPASCNINDGKYLILKSKLHQYVVYEKRQLHNFSKAGFIIHLPPKYIQPDTYLVNVLMVKNGISATYNTQQFVKVDY
ncbi:MAG: hypothetical protein KA313_07880 [Pseudarcicella sp.]|jgi:hypothetical protein|nr:hypothetical protein [Pseudarcicella sp.]MBP6411000.1 hypothetical protein [Pseudarcicella sp.]